MKYLYNVYDTETDEQVLRLADHKEVCTYFGVNRIDVSRYCEFDYLYRCRYRFERKKEEEAMKGYYQEKFASDWNNACEPFKRVVWVKNFAPGVTVLVGYKKMR